MKAVYHFIVAIFNNAVCCVPKGFRQHRHQGTATSKARSSYNIRYAGNSVLNFSAESWYRTLSISSSSCFFPHQFPKLGLPAPQSTCHMPSVLLHQKFYNKLHEHFQTLDSKPMRNTYFYQRNSNCVFRTTFFHSSNRRNPQPMFRCSLSNLFSRSSFVLHRCFRLSSSIIQKNGPPKPS